MIELVAVCGLLVLTFLTWEATRANTLSCGVYAQPGQWFYLKKAAMYTILVLRRWKRKRQRDNGGDMTRKGYGFSALQRQDDMEKVQPLCEDQHALDSVYISGTNKDGVFLAMRIGRQHGRKCELWLSLHVPTLGSFQSPIHPDSCVTNTDGKSFSAGGLRFECLEPMRRWKFTFNGLLRKGFSKTLAERMENTLVHAKFSFIWEAFTEKFDFDTDMSEWLLADSLAREQWTSDFWSRLKSKHQTHYEQFGEMMGTLQIEGQKEVRLNLRGLRDHSFGVRNWNSFHRYAVHVVYLEDGRVFNVCHVSIPSTTSSLRCGYLAIPCGLQRAITWTDLDLANLGEDGKIPDKYSFSFTAGGNTSVVEVTLQHQARYYMQENWCSTVHERFCNFLIDGVRGHGVGEFCYSYETSIAAVAKKVILNHQTKDLIERRVASQIQTY